MFVGTTSQLKIGAVLQLNSSELVEKSKFIFRFREVEVKLTKSLFRDRIVKRLTDLGYSAEE